MSLSSCITPGRRPVDLGGWFFNDGIKYTFPTGSEIGAGGFVVIAKEPAALMARYGVVSLGPFEGGLSGEGEKVELRKTNGEVADEVTYSNFLSVADGGGRERVPRWS